MKALPGPEHAAGKLSRATMRFLLALLVVNTVLFTAAGMAGVSRWLVIGVEVIGVVLWTAWRTWWDRAQQLANQARYMGWSAVGMERDAAGFRDSILEKDGVVAKISWQRKDVTIVEPTLAGPFRDFVELDRFLQSHRRLFGLE